jgi:hypothetical protein
LTNSGLFDIRTDAAMPFGNAGGVPSIYNLGTVLKSAGAGTNLCDFAFNNNGTVDLRSGVLALSGGYTPSSTSQLKLAIGGLAPGTQFSQLNLGGAAALAGTLSVTLTNGFSPTNGQSFAIVTYASESGQFVSQQLPALPNTLAWQVNYGATAVTLDVLQAKILNNASLLANGHFQFSVDGPNSSSVIIQGTTNLVDWVSLQTNAPFNGSLLFDEAVVAAYPGRFYRAIFVP